MVLHSREHSGDICNKATGPQVGSGGSRLTGMTPSGRSTSICRVTPNQ